MSKKNVLEGLGVTYDFAGKVALVTGATSGIGETTAYAFAQAGAKVILIGQNPGKVTKLVDNMTENGYGVYGAAIDVSDETAVKQAIDEGVAKFGKLDIAFNNAGIHSSHDNLADMSTEDFDRAMDVNLRGIYLCMKHEIPYMQKAGEGVILNTSSQGGLVGIPSISAYTASKHGVVGLTKSAAIEYARQGIRINVLCPGTCDTPMVAGAAEESPAHMQQVIDDIPLGRMGKAEEMAATVLWLCSGAAGFLVGQVIAVDGGYTTV